MKGFTKIKRLGQVISILSKYGFGELFSRSKLEKIIPNFILDRENINHSLNLSMNERIRLALQELGPAYIKFGQTFSNRDDLIAPDLILELTKLQDRVEAEPLDIYAKIEEEFGLRWDEYFLDIESVPFASASISQVYKAILLDGTKTVIKVKRSGIQELIEADILVMKDIARLLENSWEAAQRLNIYQIIVSFENSLMKEISFVNELSNIERFRKNNAKNNFVYVPKCYPEFCNNNMLCMEYVDGIKINEKEKLEEAGHDPKQIADLGMKAYLQQILEDGFFHADPHPGNFFVREDGKLIFIDFGMMGSMMPDEKEQLESLIINFVLKDAKRIIENIKSVSVIFNVKDEVKLERQIHEFFEMLDNNSIEELDINDVMNKVKGILQDNSILLPEFTYLLMRGIAIYEGIGKRLDPGMNVSEKIKPYAFTMLKNKMDPKRVLASLIQKFRSIGETFYDLPDDVRDLLKKVKNGELMIKHDVVGLNDVRVTIQSAVNRLVNAIIIAALCVGSSILIANHAAPTYKGVSILGLLGFLISGCLGLFIILSIWRKDND